VAHMNAWKAQNDHARVAASKDGDFTLVLMAGLLALIFASNPVVHAAEEELILKPISQGEFHTLAEARQQLRQLRSLGLHGEIEGLTKKEPVATVTLGPVNDLEAAQKIVKDLRLNQVEAWESKQADNAYVVHIPAGENINGVISRLRILGYENAGNGESERSHQAFKVIAWKPSQSKKEKDSHLISASGKVHANITGTVIASNSRKGNDASLLFHVDVFQKDLSIKNWTLLGGVQIDTVQSSEVPAHYHRELDFLPSYASYTSGNHRLLAGVDTSAWHSKLSSGNGNRLERQDNFTFPSLDTRAGIGRPISMLRWQYKGREFLFDTIWNPLFNSARMADTDTLAHPVDREKGRIRGLRVDPVLSRLIVAGEIGDDAPANGGLALRVSRQKRENTQHITASYGPRSNPYFVLNGQLQQALAQGVDANTALSNFSGDALKQVYQHSGSLALSEESEHWYFEVAFTEKEPVTTKDLRYETSFATELFVQYEHKFPSHKLLSASSVEFRNLETVEEILDRRSTARFGQLFSMHSEDRRWLWGTQARVGLDKKELYLHPFMTYQYNRFMNLRAELSLYYGESETEFGYHHEQHQLSMSWLAYFD